MRMGRAGQTSTQIIELSTPIKSWTAPPLGQSDRPDSPHYTDQAEKLFSPRTMKPTWWMPEDLAEHIESRTVLDYGQAAAPETDLGARLTSWAQAIEEAQLEAILSFYAEDYAGEQGRGKADLHAILSEAISNGMLSGLKVSVAPENTKIDGSHASVDKINVEGGFGTIKISLKLENRGGVWLIVASDRDESY